MTFTLPPHLTFPRNPNDVRDELIRDAEQYLLKMREHKECCGTPIVRRLLEALNQQESA